MEEYFMSKGNFTNSGGWVTKWTTEEIDILKEKYPVGGVKEVQKILLNRSHKAILSMAAKYKINQWTYNENYFEDIDCPEKAYWLGFIWADGYITKTKSFGIELSIKDKKQLEKLQKDLESNTTIKERTKKVFGKDKEFCNLEFRNKKMIEDLLKVGIIQNKTYNLQIPNISEKYYKDFIRGFFDGDGTYVLNKESHNKEISCVCYCRDFLKWIQQDFDRNKIKSSLLKQTDKTLFNLRMYDSDSILRYYYVYWDGASRYLDRKKEKMEEIYNYI